MCLWVPRAGAPERISVETGVLCSLFGATSPLCKWVDRLAESVVPWKDVGKEITRRILPRLESITLPAWYESYQRIRDAVEAARDLLETIQGGELPVEALCAAGPPPAPPDVNWLDVALAFSTVYPDALLDKLSQVYLFRAFYEHCECSGRQPVDTSAPSAGPIPPFPPLPPDGDSGCIRWIREQYERSLEAYKRAIGEITTNMRGVAEAVADVLLNVPIVEVRLLDAVGVAPDPIRPTGRRDRRYRYHVGHCCSVLGEWYQFGSSHTHLLYQVVDAEQVVTLLWGRDWEFRQWWGDPSEWRAAVEQWDAMRAAAGESPVPAEVVWVFIPYGYTVCVETPPEIPDIPDPFPIVPVPLEPGVCDQLEEIGFLRLCCPDPDEDGGDGGGGEPGGGRECGTVYATVPSYDMQTRTVGSVVLSAHVNHDS